ncbi:MAG: bifunctional sulfate adenylyltransferase/adenylylsulfate kinase [Thermodesulfobacteriota bacterium]
MDQFCALPHGGNLVRPMASPDRARELSGLSRDIVSLSLTPRQLSDLELILCGAFSPLPGFMGREATGSVIKSMRLPDGTLWPVPVNLEIPEKRAEKIALGDKVALRDNEGFLLAVLTVSEKFIPSLGEEAELVYGTSDPNHPGVARLLSRAGCVALSGPLEGVQAPLHYAFRQLRHTPAEIRALFRKLGWRRAVGFHTSRPVHRAQHALTLAAMGRANAGLLLHPVAGRVRPDDMDTYARLRCYLSLARYYPHSSMILSLLPLSMRMAGPREALFHAIVRKNYGCTHFIVGPDHAGAGRDGGGRPYYPPEAARELCQTHSRELGLEILGFDFLSYSPEKSAFAENGPNDSADRASSEAEVAERLRRGENLPSWFSFPEVEEEIRRAHPPRSTAGFTIFCTGLSGAGKSTLAKLLYARFAEEGKRPVTLLDGDIVRKNLSSELGFSREHRDLNVHRIGFVASEITKNRGIAICAPIAPYRKTRREVRAGIEVYGGFIEVYVNTPLSVCEARDVKGLYAKARAGIIPEFTGVSDPYEPPERPEVIVDTTDMTPDEAAQEVFLYLTRAGYIR